MKDKQPPGEVDVREPVVAATPADTTDTDRSDEIELTDDAKKVDDEASRLAVLPHAERIAQLGQVAKRLKIPRKDLERLVKDKRAERAKHLKVVDFPDDARVNTNDVYQVIAGKMVYNKPTKDGSVPVYLSNFVAKIVSDVERDDGILGLHAEKTCRRRVVAFLRSARFFHGVVY